MTKRLPTCGSGGRRLTGKSWKTGNPSCGSCALICPSLELKRRVRITALAKAEMRDAASWYEEKKPGLGAEFLDKIDETLDRIQDHPLSFRAIIDDLRRANVERFPYGLWFVAEPDGSIVIACLHHRRNNPKLAREHRKGLEP